MTETDVKEIRKYYMSLADEQIGGNSVQLIADLWGVRKDEIFPLLKDLVANNKKKKSTRGTSDHVRLQRTKEELAVAREQIPDLVTQGFSDNYISRELGCSQAWISYQRRKFNLPPNYEHSTWTMPKKKERVT